MRYGRRRRPRRRRACLWRHRHGPRCRIHDIKPDGILDTFVYDALAEVRARTGPFTRLCRRHFPRPYAVTGVYLHDQARFDIKEYGTPLVSDAGAAHNFQFKSRCTDEVADTLEIVARHHIPARFVAPNQIASPGVNALMLTKCVCSTPEPIRVRAAFPTGFVPLRARLAPNDAEIPCTLPMAGSS